MQRRCGNIRGVMHKFLSIWHDWRFWPVLCLFSGLACFVFSYPVVAFDFDLWYHLLGGAYILEHWKLPDGPFFSYLPTSDRWIDYYWLFQVCVQLLYKWGGYVALIVFRSILYCTTILFLHAYIRAEDRRGDTGVYVLGLAVFCAYALAILPRDLLLRPHAFTYLLIVVFHILANHRPGWSWTMPFLAVLWTNVHGVEYPVMLLICGAYLAEYFGAALLRREAPETLRRVRWPLIVSLYAVLATPAGFGLLAKPFAAPLFHERIISELNPQALGNFLSFSLYPGANSIETASNGLVLFLVLGGVALAWTRRLRLSRVLLFAGGAFLLPQSRRFTYEFLLLCLPLAGDVIALVADRRQRVISWKAACVAGFVLVAASLGCVGAYLANGARYPVDLARLPVGVCNFLEKEGPGGRILNMPDSGGYLQWRLYPRYTIFMDLQTMLFSSYDLFVSMNAFNDKLVMRRTLEKYEPGYILANVNNAEFKKVIGEFERFVPVFFDDVLVLYIDSTLYPELAAKYRLLTLDSTKWMQDDYEKMEASQRDKALDECFRLLKIYPDGLVANAIAAKIYLSRDDTALAAVHAALIRRNFPDRYMGYALSGLVAFKEGRYDEALSYNLAAFKRALPAERLMVVRNLFATYARLKDFGKAYETLSTVINPMAWNTSGKDLYDMAMAAVASGRTREGRLLLQMAKTKTDGAETATLAEIESLQRLLPAGAD